MPETKIINPVETLQSFMHRKTMQDATMAQEAQKLVNVFRHLDVLGDEYIEPFNQQLLSTPKEVIMVLPTIIGGSLVRQYAEYLNRQLGTTTETTDDVAVEQGEDGYLPEPENDIPFAMPSGGAVAPAAGLSTQKTIEVIDTLLSAQGEMFTEALDKIAVQTNEAAARQTAEITRALTAAQRSYYSVIEEKPLPARAQTEEEAIPETPPMPVPVEAPVEQSVAPAPLAPEADELLDLMPYEIPTVIDEPLPPRESTPFEPDGDVEILSEIELPEG